MTPNLELPSATGPRVMILEAIERHGGILRSRHGVQARLTSIHGELASSDTTRLLRDMEKVGLVALNQVPGPNGGRKITEAMLITVPPNFVAPISKLRSKKNVSGFASPPAPETDEPATGQAPSEEDLQGIAHMMAEVEMAERVAERRMQDTSGSRLLDVQQQVADLIFERSQLKAEVESLRATVVRQATQLAAQ